MHANYDLITCTSKETKKIYAEAFNTSADKIQVWGMPRIDYILGKDDEINEKIKKLYFEYPKLEKKETILYVPTFRKGETIEVDKIIEAVDKEKYNLIIRLHPLDNTKVDSKYIINGKYSTIDLIKIADYVITDYSAIAFEAAILNKQLYFYLYDIDKYKMDRGLNIDLKKEMPISTKEDIKDIVEIIKKDTYNFEELEKFKEKYVQTVDTNNTARIVEYIQNSL